MSAFKARAADAKSRNEQLLCVLMIDKMSIHKQVEWNGSKFVDYVDLGNEVNDDSNPVATEALVFLVVALRQNWKIPCGYFLVHGLAGRERANIVKQCLLKLHDVGVTVISLTCDGPSCHFSMMHELGANLDLVNLQAYFCHPADESL